MTKVCEKCDYKDVQTLTWVNKERFTIGTPVYWTDPEGISNDVYKVLNNENDDYCLIGNEYSEAEVPYGEIRLIEE